MPKIAVYGSLRVGEYNNRGIGDYIETTRIEGFKLMSYQRGPYPYAVEDPESSIIVDLLEISDEDKRWIDAMEVGAGYTIKSVNIDAEDYTIYVQDNPDEELIEITNGDWTKRQEVEEYV